jgi:beta-1,2-mannobiose phosphorylase / 1,2-beta-oligomannan phosphorylase
MIKVNRFIGNPIITPDPKDKWRAVSTFNASPIEYDGKVFMLYRAESEEVEIEGKKFSASTIGCCESEDRVNFTNHRQLIVGDYEFDKFGCEDPRITKIGDKYYIFYTALSKYPPDVLSIKVAVAITRDFKKIEEKHLVTSFNAKAMALFPERINDNLAAILTVDTDQPPSKIGIAFFQKEEQIWDSTYWHNWYKKLDHYIVPLLRAPYDQVEVGAVPIKTSEGWLLIYSYIRNYLSSEKIFGIEALLLDLKNPLKILGRIDSPLLVPEKDYEINGNVPNVIFPSGALVHNNELGIYYGASDTTVCLAALKMNDVLSSLRHLEYIETAPAHGATLFKRYSDNPIMSPVPEHEWESKYVLNPAAIYLDNKVFILYRAMGNEDTSVIGLGISDDGVHIRERLPEPIYKPREPFETGFKDRFSGCEDARINKIGDRLYMTYTAFDGINPPRVALTSINEADFLAKKWNFEKPVLISPPGRDDKNACILNEKVNGKYVILHRFTPNIWVDFVDDLKFGKNKWIDGDVLMEPRVRMWDSEKIGIGPPPIKVENGWLLIYHAISKFDKQYRLGAVLLDFGAEKKVVSRLPYPILEPKAKYENSGLRPGTVFACGAVVKNDELFVYYGGADQYVCVASLNMNDLLKDLDNHRQD